VAGDVKRFVPPTYDLRELGGGLTTHRRLDRLADRVLEVAGEEAGAAFERVPAYAAAAATAPGGAGDFFRATTRERYLVELAACVVMNRQYWPAFVARRDTVLILPDCLRRRGDGCERRRTRYGPRCRVCDPGCAIGRLTVAASRHGAAAYFSDRDHGRQFAALRRGRYGDLSVLGVACVWMLANGLRAAEEAGVPAQGVPLDFCGCEHWTGRVEVTDVSVERVEQLLAAKAAARRKEEDA